MQYHNFQSKIFCLTVPNYFIEEPFRVSLNLIIEKIYASEGYVTILRRFFFGFAVTKNFAENPFCAVFRKVSGSD